MKTNFQLLYLVLFLGLHVVTNAQNNNQCGTPDLSNQEAIAFMNTLNLNIYSNDNNEVLYNVPVKLIIINEDNGDNNLGFQTEKVLQAIEEANSKLPSEINLYLCEVEEVNNSFYTGSIGLTGFRDIVMPLYNRDDAINIYQVQNISFSSEPQSIGYAFRLGSHPTNVGVLLKSLNTQTFIHELGHFLGLSHTFRESTQLSFLPISHGYNIFLDPDASNCICCECFDVFGIQEFCSEDDCSDPCDCNCEENGDMICDTPVDPGIDYCNSIGNTPCLIDTVDYEGNPIQFLYTPDYSNYMSYYTNRTSFSDQQKDRMLQTFMAHGQHLISNENTECELIDTPNYIENLNGTVELIKFDENQNFISEPLEQFKVNQKVIITSQESNPSTNSEGIYGINNNLIFIAEDKDVKIGQKDNINLATFDFQEGITVFDLIAVQRHILNTQLLSPPYSWLAADVTNDGEITILDLVEIRRAILGTILSFESPSFRLVPRYRLFQEWGFSTSFLNDPFSAIWFDENNNPHPYIGDESSNIKSYIDELQVNLLDERLNEENAWSFFAVKSGDVNLDIDLNEGGLDDEANTRFFLSSNSHSCLNQGDFFTLEVNLSTIEDISGYQFSLSFDLQEVDFIGINKGEINSFSIDDFNKSSLESGEIKTVWMNNPEQAISFTESPKTIFKLHLRANTIICDILDIFSVNEEGMKNLVIGDNLELQKGVSLDISVSNIEIKNRLVDVYPNPTNHNVAFVIELDAPSDVEVQITDIYGNSTFDAIFLGEGEHTFTPDNMDTFQAGVLYYSIRIDNDIYYGSFIKI